MSEDIDIGKISEALNDKLDRDAGNPADLGKERITGWGMPDYDAIVDITSQTQYQAPCDGYIVAYGQGVSWDLYKEDNTTVVQLEMYLCGAWGKGFVPINKGMWYRYRSGSSRWFIPLKGV